MPSQFPTIMFPPSRGLNSEDDITRLPSGDLNIATNVFVNEDGSIERIDGYTDIVSSDFGTSNYAISLYEMERWDGSLEVFVIYNTVLKKIEEVLPDSWSTRSVHTGLSAWKRMGYASYNDRLYHGNGFDANRYLVPVYRHYSNDTALATANCTATADGIVLGEAIRADYTAHISSTVFHNAADGTNTIAAATATDLASLIVLANEERTDINAHRSQAGIHPSNDSYHTIELGAATSAGDVVPLLNQIKLCYNQHITDSRSLQWGITAPVTAMTVAQTAGAGLSSGTYLYALTFYNPIDGVESPPSPSASVTIASAEKRIRITAISMSTDAQSDQKRIYRTVVGGVTYYRVTTISNVTTTYTDLVTDASLGTVLPTLDYTSIPNTSIFLLFNDRIYMAGNLIDPYRLYFSEALYPHYYNAATNYFDFDIAITALSKTPNGIVVFERTKLWFLAGTNPYNFSRMQISNTVGCTNPYGVCSVEGSIVFISDYGIFVFDGTNVTMLSKKINKALLGKNIDSAALEYDAFNRRLYVTVASI